MRGSLESLHLKSSQFQRDKQSSSTIENSLGRTCAQNMLTLHSLFAIKCIILYQLLPWPCHVVSMFTFYPSIVVQSITHIDVDICHFCKHNIDYLSVCQHCSWLFLHSLIVNILAWVNSHFGSE